MKCCFTPDVRFSLIAGIALKVSLFKIALNTSWPAGEFAVSQEDRHPEKAAKLKNEVARRNRVVVVRKSLSRTGFTGPKSSVPLSEVLAAWRRIRTLYRHGRTCFQKAGCDFVSEIAVAFGQKAGRYRLHAPLISFTVDRYAQYQHPLQQAAAAGVHAMG